MLIKNEKELSTIKDENERKKEYLWEYRKHGMKIKRISSEIEEIRSMLLYPSIQNDGMPHGSNQSDLSDYAAKLTEKEEALYLEGVEQVKTHKDIDYRINQMENEDERDVLFYRYIKNKRWWEIAELMGYSERHITRIHGNALKHFELPKDVLECPTKM